MQITTTKPKKTQKTEREKERERLTSNEWINPHFLSKTLFLWLDIPYKYLNYSVQYNDVQDRYKPGKNHLKDYKAS